VPPRRAGVDEFMMTASEPLFHPTLIISCLQRQKISVPFILSFPEYVSYGATGRVYRCSSHGLVAKVFESSNLSALRKEATFLALASTTPACSVPRFWGAFTGDILCIISSDAGHAIDSFHALSTRQVYVNSLMFLPLNFRSRYSLTVAVKQLHRRGIHHHDLRKENILVDSHGILSIIDFDNSVFGEECMSWCPDLELLASLPSPA
jgi:serine/threonine protein kinase